MIGVAAYCCVRFFRPVLQVAGHGRPLESWHLLMVTTMAGMLLVPSFHEHRLVMTYLGTLFAVGLVWSAWEAGRRHLRAAHLRLAVAAAAMVAMVVPLGQAAAAGPGHAGMPQHDVPVAATLPAAATLLLVVALGLVLAVSLARLLRRTSPGAARADAVCESLMTLAMGWMLRASS